MNIRSTPIRVATPARAAAAPVAVKSEAQPAVRQPQPNKQIQARGPVATGGAITGAIAGGIGGGLGGGILGFGLMMAGMLSMPLAVPVIAGAVLGAGAGALALGGAGKLIEWVGSKF